MVSFVGLGDFRVFTMTLPFGERILEQISPYFGHYSHFFKIVVLFQKAEYSIRKFFPNTVLQCFDFTKRFVNFRVSQLLQASKKHLVTISSLLKAQIVESAN